MKENGKKHLDFDSILRKTLHWLERVVAVVCILGLIMAIVVECVRLFCGTGYYEDLRHLLLNLLAVVVGIEFVKMLIDITPANVIEVLVVALTRHVVVTHQEPWGNLASIVCILALFAARRYLIRPEELKEDMTDE